MVTRLKKEEARALRGRPSSVPPRVQDELLVRVQEENAVLRQQLEEVRTRVAALMQLALRHFPPGVELAYPAEGDDERAPFFSEAYLYPIFGKDEARTILAYVNQMLDALHVRRPDVYLRKMKALDLVARAVTTVRFSGGDERTAIEQLRRMISEWLSASEETRQQEQSARQAWRHLIP